MGVLPARASPSHNLDSDGAKAEQPPTNAETATVWHSHLNIREVGQDLDLGSANKCKLISEPDHHRPARSSTGVKEYHHITAMASILGALIPHRGQKLPCLGPDQVQTLQLGLFFRP